MVRKMAGDYAQAADGAAKLHAADMKNCTSQAGIENWDLKSEVNEYFL